MASLMQILNRLLPFATPGTPLIQDLIHLALICTLLYFAPQIQDHLTRKDHAEDTTAHLEPEAIPVDGADDQNRGAPAPENREAAEQEIAQDAGDEVHDAGFQAFQRDQINEGNEAGPADGAAADLPAQRNVGAKKAKSIARRDQRRAYHEFQRVQGDAERARDAEGAKEREAAQAAERERRKAVEAKLEEKKVKDREQKKESERREREDELRRREQAVAIVRRSLDEAKVCNLFDIAKEVGGDEVDDLWVERIVKANGLVGKREDGSLTMITETGWIVKVESQDMRTVYEKAIELRLGDEQGKIRYDEIGGLLEGVLSGRSPAVAG